MQLKEQRYVIAIADTGNLTRAAQQLYISQPALSLFLHNLETALNMQLFHQVGRQMVPTPAGELYLEKARQMVALDEQLNQELHDLVRGRTERLRIGMQAIRSNDLGARLIARIWKEFPQIGLSWYDEVYSALEQMLISDQIDLFFCNRQHTKRELEYLPLYQDEIVLIVNRDHPLVSKAVPSEDGGFPWIDISLFRHERFLLAQPSQSVRVHADRILAEAGIRPTQVCYLRRIYTIISLVNRGEGVAFTCAQYIPASNSHENVAAFRVGRHKHYAEFCAIYRKGTQLSEAALQLIEWTRQAMSEGEEALHRKQTVCAGAARQTE